MSNKEEEKIYTGHNKKGKAFDVFMRNQNKLYVNSFNVIDRKAAIMIKVNATITSAVVIFFENVQDLRFGTFIGVVMIISSFSSLLFALNASRPNTFGLFGSIKKSTAKKYHKLEEHIFCVGLTREVSLDEYENAYNEIFKNQELQIGNQVRTIYAFEKTIKKAFQYIEISYNIFIAGFVITVVTFLAENLLSLF